MAEQDPYEKVRYRHLISWPERLRREGPLLERVLNDGPSRRVIDLGCGPGDHARFLASRGFEVTGVDSSPAMIEASHSEPVPRKAQFILGDFLELPSLVSGKYGGAICLGNVLPHLTDAAQLRKLANGLHQVLAPGGRVLLQILNYERMAITGERALPVNVQSDPDLESAELVLVRVMKLHPNGSVTFFPTTLRIQPDADPPVEVVGSRRVDLYGWRRDEVRAIFGEGGFEEIEALGSFDGIRFDARSSRDLIWIGRRR